MIHHNSSALILGELPASRRRRRLIQTSRIALVSFSLSLSCASTKAQLLIGDWGNKAGGIDDVVLRFNASTGVYQGFFASGGGLDAPLDMLYGPDRNLYVSSGGSQNVIAFNGLTGSFLRVATAGGIAWSYGIAFGPDGNLYVSNATGLYQNTVLRYNATTGALLGVFASGLNNPRDQIFDSDGNLYVANYGTDQVLKFNGLSGAPSGSFAASPLNGPHGLAFGPGGDLFVSNDTGNKIDRFQAGTGVYLSTLSTTGLFNPANMQFGPDGNLYVANRGTNSAITRYNPNSGAFIDVFASGSGLTAPQALVFIPAPIPEIPTLVSMIIGIVILVSRRILHQPRRGA